MNRSQSFLPEKKSPSQNSDITNNNNCLRKFSVFHILYAAAAPEPTLMTKEVGLVLAGTFNHLAVLWYKSHA